MAQMILGKKAGMQLTLGFTVMLIMGIVVFILSLGFLGKFFIEAENMKMALDDHTKMQIENLLSGDARVAIPIETRTIKQGDSEVFGIGIKNTVGSEPYFLVQMEGSVFIPIEDQQMDYKLQCDKISKECIILDGYNGDGQNIDYDGGELKYLVKYQVGSEILKIDINEKHTTLISFQAFSKAPRGHYIFNIKVCSGSVDPGTGSIVPNSPLFKCKPQNNILYDNSIHKLHLYVK